MTKRRYSRREYEDALVFKVKVAGGGCQVHANPADCDGPIQACHLIPKQALRRRGLHDRVWDARNGIGACYRAHRRSDAGLERFPEIPPQAWEFARELDLEWMLEKLYGVQSTGRADG